MYVRVPAEIKKTNALLLYLPQYRGSFTVNINCFGTKYDANLEIMSCQVLFYQFSIHQDPKKSWRVSLKILFFARFSLVSLSMHPRSRRGAEWIDQQQQEQQSVASAILATTQQSVRNTTTLIITHTFRSASTFRLWGHIYIWN